MSEQLTVARLRDLLETMRPDAPVSIEGCDCVGAASGVELWLDGVLITRDEGAGFDDIDDLDDPTSEPTP